MLVLGTEIVPEQLSGDLPAQFFAILKRMVEMETGEDSRPVHLAQPVARIFKRMRVNTIAEASGGYRDVYFRRSEEVLPRDAKRRLSGSHGRPDIQDGPAWHLRASRMHQLQVRGSLHRLGSPSLAARSCRCISH